MYQNVCDEIFFSTNIIVTMTIPWVELMAQSLIFVFQEV